MVKTALLFVLCILMYSQSSVADIYKWVDENGVTHFSDTITDQDKMDDPEILVPDKSRPKQSDAVRDDQLYRKLIGYYDNNDYQKLQQEFVQGTRPNVLSRRNQMPLHYMITVPDHDFSKKFRFIKLLLDNHAGVNDIARGYEGMGSQKPPLMIAAAHGIPNVVKLLLAYGADPSYVAPGKGGMTAYKMAQMMKQYTRLDDEKKQYDKVIQFLSDK